MTLWKDVLCVGRFRSLELAMFDCTLLCVESISAACEFTSTVSVTAPTSRRTSMVGRCPTSRSICSCLNVRKPVEVDRKSTRLNSSHLGISYAVFCLKKKKRILIVQSETTTQITARNTLRLIEFV